jgi:hypothetical protein
LVWNINSNHVLFSKYASSNGTNKRGKIKNRRYKMKRIYYKLTDQDNKTKNDTLWGENVTHKASGTGNKLCSSNVIHAYDTPYQALLMNPNHADILNPKLWIADGENEVNNDGTKVGLKSLTTIKQIEIPDFKLELKVEIAIHLALQVKNNKKFRIWAIKWLDNIDRSYTAAAAAADVAAAGAAGAAARAADVAAAGAAGDAARAATRAAARAAGDAAAAAARAAARAAAAYAYLLEETIYNVLSGHGIEDL